MPKPGAEPSSSKQQPSLVNLPIEKIVPSTANPRLTLDAEKLKELKKSIENNGLLQPIAVRLVGDQYEILGGHRRYHATRELAREHPGDPRFTSIPALIVDVLENRVAAARLAENINRADLNPLEVAEGVAEALKAGMTPEELAESLGCGRRNVYRFKQLDASPPWFKAFATEVLEPVPRMKDGQPVRDPVTDAVVHDINKLPPLPITHLHELLTLYNVLHDADTKELAKKGGDGFRPRAESTVKKLARAASKEQWSQAKLRVEIERVKDTRTEKSGAEKKKANRAAFTITKERASIELKRKLSASERAELAAQLAPALKALGFKNVMLHDDATAS